MKLKDFAMLKAKEEEKAILKLKSAAILNLKLYEYASFDEKQEWSATTLEKVRIEPRAFNEWIIVRTSSSRLYHDTQCRPCT